MQLCDNFDELSLSSEHSDVKSSNDDSNDASDAECPKCGLVYGDGDSDDLWICCDNCNTWYDLKCTSVACDNLPEIFHCDSWFVSTLFTLCKTRIVSKFDGY